MMLLQPMYFAGDGPPESRLLAPAGETGAAVIWWAGDRPGYFVEWEGNGSCGVWADEVTTPRRDGYANQPAGGLGASPGQRVGR